MKHCWPGSKISVGRTEASVPFWRFALCDREFLVKGIDSRELQIGSLRSGGFPIRGPNLISSVLNLSVCCWAGLLSLQDFELSNQMAEMRCAKIEGRAS